MATNNDLIAFRKALLSINQEISDLIRKGGQNLTETLNRIIAAQKKMNNLILTVPKVQASQKDVALINKLQDTVEKLDTSLKRQYLNHDLRKNHEQKKAPKPPSSTPGFKR